MLCRDTLDSRSPCRYVQDMSTVVEVKVAVERLSAEDRWELYRWLGQSKELQQFRHEELRREIGIGLDQANRGDLALLDVQAVKREVRRRLHGARDIPETFD